MTKQKVSVIIPLKQLSYYLIFESLPAFTRQTYKNFEVIVLPNEQALYDVSLLKKYKFLRIIPTGKVTRPAEKRDIGAQKAQGSLLAFIDDDAYPADNWLEQAAKYFSRKNVAAVCGPGILPKKSDFWERVFDQVLKTWIGAGGYSYRFIPGKKQFVDDYPSMNFLIKKTIFTDLGGFNSDYWPGEDSKLCNDIVYKKNLKILYQPGVLVYHHRRNNLYSYLKQHSNYGFHRGAFFAHGDKNSRRLSYLVPTAFFLYVVIFGVTIILFYLLELPRIFVYIFSLPIILYLLATVYVVLKSFVETLSVKVSLGAATTLFLTHAIYATMFVKGFLRGLNKSKTIYDH